MLYVLVKHLLPDLMVFCFICLTLFNVFHNTTVKPEVTVHDERIEAKKGDVVTMACVAEGHPLVNTYWLVPPHNNRQDVNSDPWKYVVKPNQRLIG